MQAERDGIAVHTGQKRFDFRIIRRKNGLQFADGLPVNCFLAVCGCHHVDVFLMCLSLQLRTRSGAILGSKKPAATCKLFLFRIEWLLKLLRKRLQRSIERWVQPQIDRIMVERIKNHKKSLLVTNHYLNI